MQKWWPKGCFILLGVFPRENSFTKLQRMHSKVERKHLFIFIWYIFGPIHFFQHKQHILSQLYTTVYIAMLSLKSLCIPMAGIKPRSAVPYTDAWKIIYESLFYRCIKYTFSSFVKRYIKKQIWILICMRPFLMYRHSASLAWFFHAVAFQTYIHTCIYSHCFRVYYISIQKIYHFTDST
jgi:hypothetical protein